MYHQKSTDEALMHGCREGNRLAQKYLYQRYYGKFLGIPYRYVGNKEEAQEILNIAFTKIFDSVKEFRETGSFAGWMSRIIVHTAIDFVRSRQRYRRTFDHNTEWADTPVSNEVVSQLAIEDLYALIQKIPDSSRTVFCMYVIDGYKHSEIAAMLNIDEGTSKWHLSNARRFLQPLVRQQYAIGD
jgi:RNA polymerase sigma factor (sigma-70 family)